MKALYLLGIVVLVAVACEREQYRTETTDYGQSGVEASVSDRADFSSDMQRVWSDHIALTRMYIGSATANAPDTKAIAERLMENQEQIASAVRPYYGDEAADKLTSLLKEHISFAVETLNAAKAKNDAQLSAAKTKLYENGDQIATLLANANTRWDVDELKTHMKAHLDLLLEQTADHIDGNYRDGLEAYDRAHTQIIEMARMLSDGTIEQFADRFNP
jgi:ElaB/YqjD/DUF883 family membrane-anchored ribosome-binding protein